MLKLKDNTENNENYNTATFEVGDNISLVRFIKTKVETKG